MRINWAVSALSRVVLLRLVPTDRESEPGLQLERRNSPMRERRLVVSMSEPLNSYQLEE